MSSFIDEVEEAIGARPTNWTFHPADHLDYSAHIWFKHSWSEDTPEGEPLSWEQLDTLNREYDVVEVESHSHGETGSKLCVTVADP